MTQDKMDRINELSRTARERELTQGEQTEREELRKEFIADYRASLKSQLDSIVVQGPDGKRAPLKKPENGKPPNEN